MDIKPYPPTYSEKNNPVWEVPVTIKITRMDNTISMDMQVAQFKDDDGNVVGDVTTPLGGMAYIVHKDGKAYAIEVSPVVKAVFNNTDKFVADRKPLPKKK